MAFGRVRTGVAVAVALAAGCGGPQLGTVTGTVTLDGKPVAGGTISFVPPTGTPITVAIQADGTYLAENVPPGEMPVSVNPPSGTDPVVEKEAKGSARKPPPPWPPRYADPIRSGLKCTIQPGPNTFDAKMTKS